jgi:uncharacterized protein YlxW (UPF0749 family)
MTSRPPQSENLSAALLVDLVTNTLDPGYASAAARKAADRGHERRWLDRTLVATGCALVGFTLMVAYISTHRAAPETAKVHSDLVARVRTAESSGNKLDATAQQLSTRINSLRNQALSGSAPLSAELQREQLLAGAIAVKGPGVLVQLADPPTPTATAAPGRKTTPIGATQLLTDRDLRSVVNQLWTDGAEAISVNNVRLTPTSAIRFAGQAVLVDFEPINAPYSIRAIGNADQLDTGFAASAVASRYQTLAAADGIGFSFEESTQLQLPASTLDDLHYAHPVGETSAGAPAAPAPDTASKTTTEPSPSTGASR